jgi:hypothetical protein
MYDTPGRTLVFYAAGYDRESDALFHEHTDRRSVGDAAR